MSDQRTDSHVEDPDEKDLGKEKIETSGEPEPDKNS